MGDQKAEWELNDNWYRHHTHEDLVAEIRGLQNEVKLHKDETKGLKSKIKRHNKKCTDANAAHFKIELPE